MIALPDAYRLLANEPGPKMLLEALKLYGTHEREGSGDNPVILDWAKELGLKQYTTDAIPWCGLFVALLAHRSGKAMPSSPLWALSWATWGDKSPAPALGDVLVFKRQGGGHVGLYVAEDADYYHVLGGNQGDAVSITRIAKSRLYAARRSYRNTPANVRPIHAMANGAVSTNEA